MNRRSTIQRSLVLETVKSLHSHVTADEVYDTIVTKYPDISRGTVYRNLKLLSDNGEVRKVDIPGVAALYDYLCHDHYHTRCVVCGRVFDVEMEYISDLEKSIIDPHGFTYLGHDIVFKSICPTCDT